ncbi:MAG: YfcE family phosphodiesterase [Desulfurivibrionaceae bacterium]|nr:YfcE family phosphodiesterase [Desulfurivibrionaceae bacterium]
MALTRIGILSDTHLDRPSERFTKEVEACFSDISIIFHAGDLTAAAVLDVFRGRELHGVHGNMCDKSARDRLPSLREITINGFKIILTHGHHFGCHGLEDRLFSQFAEADCIVYGHTHQAVCHRVGHILLINPGSFRSTGRFGTPGTYAILEIDDRLHGRIMPVPEV